MKLDSLNHKKTYIILDKVNDINRLVSNKNDIISLIALAYYSSFSKNLINDKFINDKFQSLLNYLATDKCHLLIATNKNKIIGLCHYFIKDDFEGKRGHLNQIAIIPNAQGSKFIIKDNAKMGGGIMLMKQNNPQNQNNNKQILHTTSIARELIKMMENHLLEQNIYSIDLFVSSNNLKAINLYQDIGFVEHRKLMLKDISRLKK